MAKNRKIKDYIDDLKVIKPHVLSNDIKVGDSFHVPPIISVKRMDIVITSKENNSFKFKITSDATETKEIVMDETSILSKFIVKKRKF